MHKLLLFVLKDANFVIGECFEHLVFIVAALCLDDFLIKLNIKNILGNSNEHPKGFHLHCVGNSVYYASSLLT